jgi:hypothetical protein
MSAGNGLSVAEYGTEDTDGQSQNYSSYYNVA